MAKLSISGSKKKITVVWFTDVGKVKSGTTILHLMQGELSHSVFAKGIQTQYIANDALYEKIGSAYGKSVTKMGFDDITYAKIPPYVVCSKIPAFETGLDEPLAEIYPQLERHGVYCYSIPSQHSKISIHLKIVTEPKWKYETSHCAIEDPAETEVSHNRGINTTIQYKVHITVIEVFSSHCVFPTKNFELS